MNDPARSYQQQNWGRLLCAAALRPAMVELLSLFKADTGNALAIDCDFNPIVAQRIENGEEFDVTVINPHLIDRLVGLGLVDVDTWTSWQALGERDGDVTAQCCDRKWSVSLRPQWRGHAA